MRLLIRTPMLNHEVSEVASMPFPPDRWTGAEIHDLALTMLGVLGLEREQAVLHLAEVDGAGWLEVWDRWTMGEIRWCQTSALPLSGEAIEEAREMMPANGFFLGEQV